MAPPTGLELGSWPRPCKTSRNPLPVGLVIPPGWVGRSPVCGCEDPSHRRSALGLEAGVAAMTVPVRSFSLLCGRLGQVPALGGSAAQLVGVPGAAGRTFRGFRSSGVR